MTEKRTLLLSLFIAAMSSIAVVNTMASGNTKSVSLWKVVTKARDHIDNIPPRVWNNVSQTWQYASAPERQKTALVAGLAATVALVSAYEYVRFKYDNDQWRKEHPNTAHFLKRSAVYGRGAAEWGWWAGKWVLGLYVVSSAVHWANGHTKPVTSTLNDMARAVKRLASREPNKTPVPSVELGG